MLDGKLLPSQEPSQLCSWRHLLTLARWWLDPPFMVRSIFSCGSTLSWFPCIFWPWETGNCRPERREGPLTLCKTTNSSHFKHLPDPEWQPFHYKIHHSFPPTACQGFHRQEFTPLFFLVSVNQPECPHEWSSTTGLRTTKQHSAQGLLQHIWLSMNHFARSYLYRYKLALTVLSCITICSDSACLYPVWLLADMVMQVSEKKKCNKTMANEFINFFIFLLHPPAA